MSHPPPPKRSRTDPRLTPKPRSTKTSGKSHPIQSYDFVDIPPVNFTPGPLPKMLEFVVSSEKLLLPGPVTRFRVSGIIEKEVTTGEGATRKTEWKPAVPDDAKDNTFAPNWFEMLFKSFRVYQDNKEIKTHNEPDHLMVLLNCFFYGFMDKAAKKELAPKPAHPAHSVSVLAGKHGSSTATAIADGDVWRKSYAEALFKAGGFSFEWIPPLQWPFWQGRDFPLDQYDGTAVPLPNFAKPLEIQIILNEDLSKVVKGATKFRLSVSKFALRLEQPRLNPTSEKAQLAKLKRVSYRGTTKLLLPETIPAGVQMHRVRFHDFEFPDGLFIFCVHKSHIGGTFDFNAAASTDLFLQHGIEKYELAFGGKDFFHKEPHYGQITLEVIERKISLDHRYAPPFGVALDPDLVTRELVADGCKNTAFPHVYVNLRNWPDGLRTAPLLDDGSILNAKRDLDLTLRFNTNGAVKDATYMIYAFYEDDYLDMDVDARGEVRFSNQHLLKNG
jgi:hypothetical protein